MKRMALVLITVVAGCGGPYYSASMMARRACPQGAASVSAPYDAGTDNSAWVITCKNGQVKEAISDGRITR